MYTRKMNMTFGVTELLQVRPRVSPVRDSKQPAFTFPSDFCAAGSAAGRLGEIS